MERKRALGAVVSALALTATACSGGNGADAQRAAGPATTAAAASVPRQLVEGFGAVAYRVSTMPAAERCALLAESALQKARGLMGRTDLAGHDGMLFVWDSDTSGGFWMKDTVLPLSIAWFDAGGRFVSSADMEPCLNRGSNCPNYDPAGPYRFALEVPQGKLAAMGIGPGSVLQVGGPCP